MAVIKGTELGGIKTFIPGAELGPPTPNVQGVQTSMSISTGDLYGVVTLTPKQGFQRNLGGNAVTDYDLGDTNPNFSSVLASLFPGATGDDNDIQWEVPCPTDLEDGYDFTVRLHFLIPGSLRKSQGGFLARAVLSKV